MKDQEKLMKRVNELAKQVISWLMSEQGIIFILAMVAIAAICLCNSDISVTVASVLVTGTAGGKHVTGEPLTTTLTTQASPTLLRNEIDDRIIKVRPMATPIDHIMGSSAKGVLLFPEDQLPASMTWEHIANNWSACNGIIPYEPKAGLPGPQQITSKNTDIGAYELLSLEMKLLEDVSGVNGALQGKNASATTSATLYESQIRNATIALTDLFETFASFRRQRDNLIKRLDTPPQTLDQFAISPTHC